MSLHAIADHMASKGRGPDTMLIHMAPSEVRGLQSLAQAHGGSLTINPETGLPEAGFLDKLLPTLIGGALTVASGGALSPLMAGMIVGGVQAVRTGDLGQGLMAGLGAYGGAGLGAGLASAGESAIGAQEFASATGPNAIAPGLEGMTSQEFAQQQVADKIANASPWEKLSEGAKAATSSPQAAMDFAKDNAKNLMYSASPILAGESVKANLPTTVTQPGQVHRFSYDPYGQSYTSTGNYQVPVKAADGGLMAMNNGGYNPGQLNFTQSSGPIASMADGGIAHFDGTDGSLVTAVPGAATTVDPNATPTTVEDLYKTYAQRGSDPEGLKFWTQQFGDTIDPNEINSFKNSVAEARAQGTEGKLSQDTANSMVQNMYRNTLNRDAETSGMNYWSDMLQHSDDPTKVYQNFINSAKANTELGNFNTNDIGYTQAVSPYKGYMSADTGSNADEWVRNVLNREVTDADRNQQWYKDMANVTTTDETKKAYNDFLNSTGAKTNLDFMAASQLSPLKKKAMAGLPSITDAGNLPPGVSGGGNTVVNPNGTITTTPNIPGRPEGGFTGMGNVRDVYTAGGGSLGYLPYAPKTPEEHEALYGYKQPSGSKQAYDYLMGTSPYSATPYTATGEIQKPYSEAVMGVPADVSTKQYLFDPQTKKYKVNPDYIPVTYSDKGVKTYGLSNREIISQLPSATSDYEKWMTENSVDQARLAKALGISLAEVRKRYPLKKKDTTVAASGSGSVASNGSGEGEGYTPPPRIANGGLLALAGGGAAQYDLGGYSDGGRLLKGPGNGTSDDIPASIGNKRPARLADGEFVVPARIVSELGNGSTEAGARQLYAMMDRVQKERRKTVGKDKVAFDAKARKHLPA